LTEYLVSGRYVLDDNNDQEVPYFGTTPIGSSDSAKIVRADSPSSPLGAAYKYESDTDRFLTYLMYRPIGGIWVTLRRLEWDWSAHATKEASGWEGGGIPHVGTSVDTTELPQWSDHFRNLNWVGGV
jgi:hypothetical protein